MPCFSFVDLSPRFSLARTNTGGRARGLSEAEPGTHQKVDLKLAVATASFVKAYGAVVLDVTHGSGEGGEEAA